MLERRRRRREQRAEQKQVSRDDHREATSKPPAQQGEAPRPSDQWTETASVAHAVGTPVQGTEVEDHVLLVV